MSFCFRFDLISQNVFVCVCTFSKEVKPVLAYVWFQDDLFGEAIGLFSITFFEQILQQGSTFWKRSWGFLQVRWSTRNFIRGHRPIVDTCANEAIPQWGMQDLASLVYLKILIGF